MPATLLPHSKTLGRTKTRGVSKRHRLSESEAAAQAAGGLLHSLCHLEVLGIVGTELTWPVPGQKIKVTLATTRKKGEPPRKRSVKCVHWLGERGKGKHHGQGQLPITVYPLTKMAMKKLSLVPTQMLQTRDLQDSSQSCPVLYSQKSGRLSLLKVTQRTAI